MEPLSVEQLINLCQDAMKNKAWHINYSYPTTCTYVAFALN